MNTVDTATDQAPSTAGYALATQPVASDTIYTDSSGLVAGDVEIPAGGIMLPAYRAMPEGAGPFPTVLVVQEIFGVHEHIRDVCRRLAKLGYFAVAPELYVRQGDVSGLENIDEIREIFLRVPDAQVMDDLDHTVAWARTSGMADVDKLGITGFCWGGRIAWLYAAHNTQLKAAVAWYGRLTGYSSPLSPRHPLDLAASLHAPVLGLYGSADSGIPMDTVNAMREALQAAGKPAEIVVYADMPHAFHADYRPSYRKEAAEDGWQRMRDWFRKNGIA